MLNARQSRRVPRLLRALFVAALALVAVTCLNDRPSGPGGRAQTTIRLRRVARGGSSCGVAPTIKLAKARVLLKDPARGDSAVAVGTFQGDTATISLDLPITGNRAIIDIFAQAIDSSGDTVFRARDTASAVAGQRTTVDYLKIWYSAPDSVLESISLAPRDSMVHFNALFPMRAYGTYNDGATFSGRIRLGFVSRDPTIANVSPSGAITAYVKTGSTYIVASTWLGLCDSTMVIVVPPVASVDVKPDTADIARGSTIQLVVTLKDAGGNILIGRPVTWGSVNANASVDTAGLVTGLVANKGARIFASSEGKADTSGIGILPRPVATVAVTPKPGAVQQGSTLQMTAVAKDSNGIVDTDWPTAWSTENAGLATVSATGLVTGVKAGTVGIIATIGGVADTSPVTVSPNGPTSTVVSPNPDTLFSLGDTAQLTAQAYIGNTPTSGSFTWATRDPTVATVTATGQVIAQKNGSTYVVATEAGGTKDSSHVFVIQKVSSITVTPNPVQRYLATNQTFTAAAADARGNAISGVVFTWGQSDASITNINANSGAATMLAIGIDTIKATVGTVVGKAVLTVKSAITNIKVTPAGITLTALQQTQAYSATAYDTLNNVMSGITFAWTSTNPGVASVPGSVGTTQTATAQANGITAITATAQQVSGASNLTVAQVLVSIVAGPNPTVVGVGGQAQLIARGKDANGFFMPGGVFNWVSDAPTNVSVVAATGLVKGLILNSSAHITASAGAINSNQVLVNVDNSVPPRVSWAKDTVAISRGSLNNSIPMYLSKPPVAAVTITVAVKDTFAFFSPTTVTFGAGVTSQNANLNGRNAGVTEIYATDGSAQYAGDTSVLLVQAAAKFAFGGISLNATDFYPTQILLTDPAPAGGLYMSSSYGTAGIAQVSPDPAFIPAGQLAANVNVNGLAQGTTTITPGAPGVTGTASTVNTYAAVLHLSSGATRVIGAGQYEGSDYVSLTANTYHPLLLTFTSSDTTIATSAPNATILANNYYVFFTEFAPKLGSVTQTISAPGWVSATRTVIVSTPKVAPCCATTLNTTSAAQTLTVYTEDSLNTTHYRINPLFVTVTSSDTSIIQIIDTTLTVKAGAYYAQGKYIPGGNGGVAYVRVSAGGHVGDSIKVTVNAPNLGITFPSGRAMGVNQGTTNYAYITIPNSVSKAVTVNLASSDTNIAAVTTQITIPANQTYAYFDLRGHTLGSATITASASGYSPVSGVVVVGTPKISTCCNVNQPNFAPDYTISQTSVDSTGQARYPLTNLTVSVRSTNPAVATVDSSTVVIVAGQFSNSHGHVHFAGVGSALVISTAPGYTPDTISITVYTPTLAPYTYPGSVGKRQTILSGSYIYTPNARPESVIVHVTNPHTNILTVPDSLKIQKNTNLAYYDIAGLALGKDTLSFAATGYNGTTQALIVTPAQLRGSGFSNTYNTTSPPASFYAAAYDTIGYGHTTMDTVTVHVVSTDTTVFKVDSAYVHILKGNVNSTSNKLTFVGPGIAKVLFTDSVGVYKPDSSQAITVIGPSLHVAYGTTINNPLTVGMRQHVGLGGNYIYLDNAVTGQPLVVNLLSTDPTVATVAATVTIPVGQSVGNFDVVGKDTTGTIQIKASATGYSPVVSYVQVGQPHFIVSTSTNVVTTTPPQVIYVYAYDQSNNARYTTEDVIVTLTSSNGKVVLNDSATVTIKKDGYFTNVAKESFPNPGTATLTASDARVAYYKYMPDVTPTITVSLPTVLLNLPASTTLGLDQIIDTYVSIPNQLASPLTVTLGHTTGTTTTPASVVIAAGQYTQAYRVTGASRGSDILSASAPFNNGSSSTISVDSGVIALSGWPASVKVGDSVAVTIYSYDKASNLRYVGIPITFTLGPNANIVFDAGGSVTTTSTMAANQYFSTTFYVKGVSAGTGSVTVSGGRFAGYTNTLTVTP